VYNSTHGKDTEVIMKGIEEYENKRIIIGKNFNIRIEELREEEEDGVL